MRPRREPTETDVQTVQRRDAVRVVRARPVTVRGSAGQAAVATYSIDISGLGILLAGPDTLQLGERVRFRLILSDDEEPVVGEASVVRLDPRGYRAIRLDEISEGDRRRLVRFVFDCQREDRRRQVELEERDDR